MIIDVHLNLPLINSLRGTWNVTERESSAAWETYVEIITRISPARMDFAQRDIAWELSSLDELLNKMREILKKYGPAVGKTDRFNDLSFAHLVLTVINVVLRPILEKGQKHRGDPASDQELCRDLDRAYGILIDLCNMMAQGAGVAL